MSVRLDPDNHVWMTAPATRKVLDALTAKGGEVRFVGGVVRNTLAGAGVTDIDLATPLTPDVVIALLEAAGLKAVPTGIEHGTVTAIADSKPFEITTLRRDVSTDGRRAVVSFTGDWREDASRRDFTMNALYASPEGEVFDYFGGIQDLEAGRVRFVGDAASRIAEDYLRILRLFRFHAWYGRGEIDEAALVAAVAGKGGLKTLSGERVQKEMLKLLAAADPIPVLRSMRENGLLREIFPAAIELGRADLKRLGNLVPLTADPILRLTALVLLFSKDAVREAAHMWRLSNNDRDRMLALTGNYAMPESENAAKRQIYEKGAGLYRDQLLLTRAAIPHAVGNWQSFYDLSARWNVPRFPLDGGDVMALGIAQGPRIGELLSAVEHWWIENDFRGTREELLARLKVQASA